MIRRLILAAALLLAPSGAGAPTAHAHGDECRDTTLACATKATPAFAPDSPLRPVAAAGVAAVDRHREALSGAVDLHTWVTLSVQRGVGDVVGGLQAGLAVLATVASTAPFVGLFGTVWGIHHALTAIGVGGQASIDKVAGPVGEALIMTAIGLAVAVPAVLGCNWLVRRNRVASRRPPRHRRRW